MTHTEELERRFDGPIPAGLRTAAEALDRAAARTPVRLRLKTLKPAAIIEGMAAAMVRRRRDTGCCMIRDLKADGFTSIEIETYSDAARDKAALIWRLGKAV